MLSCKPIRHPSSSLSCLFQDVVLQWLMTENIHLNQIDAEDPEVRKYTGLENAVTGLAFLFCWRPCLIVSSRSQITPCCQTRGVCQNSSGCACKRVMKTPGTSPLFLICPCSIFQPTLYPKSSGEKTISPVRHCRVIFDVN